MGKQWTAHFIAPALDTYSTLRERWGRTAIVHCGEWLCKKAKGVCALCICIGTNVYGYVEEQPVQEQTVQQSTTYIDIAAAAIDIDIDIVPWPLIGVSHVWQRGHNALNMSLWGTTLPPFILLKTDLLYHYIPRPNPASQWYSGIGIGGATLNLTIFEYCGGHHIHDDDDIYTIGPEVVCGYQYETAGGGKRRVQLQLAEFFGIFGYARHGWPGHFFGILSYGFGF